MDYPEIYSHVPVVLPYHPLYEQTKSEIEQSIFNLEQKLRQRRELDHAIECIDYTIDRNLVEGVIGREMELADNLAEIERARHLNSVLVDEQLRVELEENRMQAEFVEKVERLRREREWLMQEAYLTRGYDGGKYGPYESDDLLIRKYEDGTRAREYYRDLEMGKIGTGGGVETASFGQDGLTNKKWLYDQTDKKTKDNSAIKSPYDRIKFESEQRNSDQKGRPPVSGMENLEKPVENRTANKPINKLERYGESDENNPNGNTNDKDQEQEQYLPMKNKYPESSQNLKAKNVDHKSSSTSKPVKLTPNQSSKRFVATSKKEEKNFSPIKRSKWFEPSNISSDALKSTHITNIEIENRLRLSEITYEDSQFRNCKHEISHLFNTYSNELKVRKDVRDKINNHPSILRKYEMVVE